MTRFILLVLFLIGAAAAHAQETKPIVGRAVTYPYVAVMQAVTVEAGPVPQDVTLTVTVTPVQAGSLYCYLYMTDEAVAIAGVDPAPSIGPEDTATPGQPVSLVITRNFSGKRIFILTTEYTGGAPPVPWSYSGTAIVSAGSVSVGASSEFTLVSMTQVASNLVLMSFFMATGTVQTVFSVDYGPTSRALSIAFEPVSLADTSTILLEDVTGTTPVLLGTFAPEDTVALVVPPEHSGLAKFRITFTNPGPLTVMGAVIRTDSSAVVSFGGGGGGGCTLWAGSRDSSLLLFLLLTATMAAMARLRPRTQTGHRDGLRPARI